MKLTNYIDLLLSSHLKRDELEEKYIELLKKYEYLEEHSINICEANWNNLFYFCLGMLLVGLMFYVGSFAV